MQEHSDPGQPLPDKSRRRSIGAQIYTRRTVWVALAALLVVVSVVWGYRIFSETRFADRSAQAMAACHHNPKGKAFSATAFPNLSDTMPQLPFSPIYPQRIETYQPEFLEARYCDIHGRPAVQIRFKGAEGSDYSLFQSPLASNDPELRDSQLFGEGVMVRLWQQDGLLMGLVENQ